MGLVLARHNDAAKEWGTLSARTLNPSCISYEPKINSRTVQGDSNRAGAQIVTGGQEFKDLRVDRVQRDRKRCLTIHGRMYSSMDSGIG